MSEDQHTIHGDGVTATVLAHGAELCSLKTAEGLELLWQAGPEWKRHAPLSFPIVEGEFSDKPGLMCIKPGATERLSYRIGVRY